MHKLPKLLVEEPPEIAVIEPSEEHLEITVMKPSEEPHKNNWLRGIIIIGDGNAGMAVATHHLVHSCATVLVVQGIGEVGTMGHTLLNSKEPSHPKIEDSFFQHLIQETTFEITALKEEFYEAMTYEYREPRIQHIKNYCQQKMGRLNTKPKPIWWYRNHQRL